jgi:hypothetical protein
MKYLVAVEIPMEKHTGSKKYPTKPLKVGTILKTKKIGNEEVIVTLFLEKYVCTVGSFICKEYLLRYSE